MKIPPRDVPVKPEFKSARPPGKLPLPADPFKWIALVITLTGIGAWLAGEAYCLGYWDASGGLGPLVQLTPQQTAFKGFVGPFRNWPYTIAIIAAALALLPLVSIRWRREKSPSSKHHRVFNFLKAHLTIDLALTAVSGLSLVVIYVFSMFIMAPIAFWTSLADSEGRKQMVAEACNARAAKNLNTVIKLGDGTKITGRMMEHSDKFALIIDQSAMSLVALGDKPQLVSTTSTLNMKCPP